jgi:hypothetical protein
MPRFLRSSLFWIPFVVASIFIGLFFAWELDFLKSLLPSLPRPAPTREEIAFSSVLGFLLAFVTGLVTWNWKYGTCPIGIKRATGFAGALGTCVIFPASLLGAGALLTIIAPYLPVLRLIAIVILGIAVWMLWPTKK